MIFENLIEKKIILASKSPRREALLRELGIKFDVITKNTSEDNVPKSINIEEIALYLAKEKAAAFENEIDENTIIITADTTVCVENEILNKPTDNEDAKRMLKKLSGKTHKVITGVCIYSIKKKVSFSVQTEVSFKNLSDDEIHYYIQNYKPFDKAGSYGIQEWIGFVAVEHINGSYFNVMGFPVHKIYLELQTF